MTTHPDSFTNIANRVHRLITDHWRGALLAVPFLSFQLPGIGSKSFFLLAVPSLILLFVQIRLVSFRQFINWPALSSFGLIFVNMYALVAGETTYIRQVFFEIATALMLLTVFFAPRAEANATKLFTGFLIAIVPFAAVTAAIGVFKSYLLNNGFVLDLFLDSCGTFYPQGSALCGDYNLYGLLLIVALIGVGAKASLPTTNKSNALIATLITLLMVAGLFAGSRRFLVLFPFIGLFLMLLFRKDGIWKVIVLSVVPTVTSAVLYLGTWQSRPPPPPYGIFTIHNFVNSISWRNQKIRQVQTRMVDPISMGSTFDDGALGAGSRIQRWRLGWDLLKNKWLTGVGFEYHKVFSCRFSSCLSIDYPHFTIISSWLAGGITGLAIAIFFYAGVLREIILSVRLKTNFAASGIAVAALPYSLFSGDTILSLPHILSAYFLLFLLNRGRRAFDT